MSGQLGDGSSITRTTPQAVAGGLMLTSVRVGGAYSCALAADSSAHCWGWGAGGQLGLGSRSDQATPGAVVGGIKFITVSAGTQHTCGLAADSTAYCWGKNDFGQLGNAGPDTTLPVPVPGGLRYRAVVVGYQYSCGLLVSGRASCWGDSTQAQLGDNTLATFSFTSLSAGAAHTCGLTGTGTAYCWGGDANGQLGSQPAQYCTTTAGPTPCTPSPTAVTGGLVFAAISAGTQHTCGLTTSQVMYCWGLNNHGQLGSGNFSGSVTPVRVASQP